MLEQSIIKYGAMVKNGTMSWVEVADIVNRENATSLTSNAIRKRYASLKEKSGVAPEEYFENKPNGTVEVSSNIWVDRNFNKTPDSVMEILGYDKELWTLQSFRVGSHEVAISEEETNRVCYNFRAILKPTEKLLSSKQALEEANKLFKGKIKPFVFKPSPVIKGLNKNKLLLMPTVEAHLGKMASEMETGSNYDHKICRDRFYEVFGRFIEYQEIEQANKCLVVIGGDFFNSEANGMTTAGTPQSNDTRYRKMFSLGLEMYSKVLLELREHFNGVDVMLAAGNHAEQMEFFLYKSLEMYFNNDKKINFTTDYKTTQSYQFGDTALFFNHGDVNHKRLIASIPAEFSNIYGDTMFRYLFSGHLHINQVINEENGLTFIRTSSIGETDEWHYKNRFGVGNTPKQEMYCVSATDGVIGNKVVVFRKEKQRVRR